MAGCQVYGQVVYREVVVSMKVSGSFGRELVNWEGASWFLTAWSWSFSDATQMTPWLRQIGPMDWEMGTVCLLARGPPGPVQGTPQC